MEFNKHFMVVSYSDVRNKGGDFKKLIVKFVLVELNGRFDVAVMNLNVIQERCNLCKASQIYNEIKHYLCEFISEGFLKVDLGLEEIMNLKPSDIFYYSLNFEMLPKSEYVKFDDVAFDRLVHNSTNKKKDQLLKTYLYIKSFYRNLEWDDGEDGAVDRRIQEMQNPAKFALFKSVNAMAKEIGFNKKTIISHLQTLCDMKMIAKYDLGNYVDAVTGEIKTCPRLYVPNYEWTNHYTMEFVAYAKRKLAEVVQLAEN